MSDGVMPTNPLAGLIGNYDSDPGSDDENMDARVNTFLKKINDVSTPVTESKTFIPAVSGCLWSACYDESSGYTYYWNQDTNEVTWEPPAEYLQALQIAQMKSVQNEVSSEEWQMYQQALAEKQKKNNDQIPQSLTPNIKPPTKNSLTTIRMQPKMIAKGAKPSSSDSDEETIELITSYHNKSDSESNEEASTPQLATAADVISVKKHGKKSKHALTEFGPSLPTEQQYSVEIGPQLPPAKIDEILQKDIVSTDVDSPHPNVQLEIEKKDIEKSFKVAEDSPTLEDDGASESNIDADDSQDETALMEQLLDKAKLLKRLGGELPRELSNLIDVKSETHTSRSATQSPKRGSEYDLSGENSKEPGGDEASVDEFLASIEQNQTSSKRSDQIVKENITEVQKSNALQENVVKHVESIGCESTVDNVLDRVSPVHISPGNSKATMLFPSAASIDSDYLTSPQLSPNSQASLSNTAMIKITSEKRGTNLYMTSDVVQSETVTKRKMRIASDVLPEVKKSDPLKVSYTTKYSHFIEGFSNERTGLGFKRKLDDFEEDSSEKKKTTGYLNFTKGETLNDSKKTTEVDCKELKSTNEILLLKLNFLNQTPVEIPPVQEMTIQLQILSSAWEAGGLSAEYFAGWLRAAADALQRLEAAAAPAGWTCHFHREEGRYSYRRVADGHTQWDFPAGEEDMDICTTPPHVTDRTPPEEHVCEDIVPSPSPPAVQSPPPPCSPPPPPVWPHTPPPPGTRHHLVRLPTHQEIEVNKQDNGQEKDSSRRESLGEELTSFYNDLAELEKQTEVPPPLVAPPVHRTTQPAPAPPHTNGTTKPSKKKTKVKISSSLGLKNKSVSSLVAKWQAVASEIKED